MRLIIAGSRRLPRGQAPRLLIRILAELYDVDSVLLRRPMTDHPGQFETDVSRLCEILGLGFEWFRPAPSPENPGRVSVFVRDMDMVAAADLAILFFTPEDAQDGYSGTYHLLDKCLDTETPVHAYIVTDHGKVSRFGDYDPDHRFAHLALDVA